MVRRWGIVVVGCALWMAMPMSGGRVSAQTEESADDAARRHFRLGQAHYENGEFAEAATEFDEAYRLSQRPQLLYNIYVSYRDAGDLPHAAEALRTYLQLVPDAENGAQLRARLASMERLLTSHGTTTTGSGASGDATTGTSGDATSTASSGDATSTTASTGDTSSSAGSTGDASASTSSVSGDTTSGTTSRSPSSSASGGFGSSPVGWIVGGVGAAAIVAGIVTGVMALDAQSSLDAMCGPDRRSCPPGFESQRSTGQSLGAATDGLLIGGGVALATGVVLLFLLTDGGTSEPPATVTGGCSPTGCSGAVSVRF